MSDVRQELPGSDGAATPAAVTTLAALGVGFILLVAFGRPILYWQRQAGFLAAAVLLSAVPVVRRAVLAAMSRLRNPSPQRRAITAWLISAIAAIYLVATGVYQERHMFPRFHDEHAYLLQAQFLAHGKLWAAAHPLADFFETIHVFVKPVYAPIYFPGAALMQVPGMWLGLPFWLTPAILSGCAVGLIYRVTTELIDGVAGLLAALLLVDLSVFRQLSLMVMSHTNMVLLGLAVVWAWLNWRRQRRGGWLVVLGALSGWAAITRPIDAIAWVAPVGAALLYDLRLEPSRRRAAKLLIVVAAAAPFLALQVVFSLRVTGSLFKTPYGSYLDQFSPQSLWGFGGSAATRPATALQQKLDYHEQFTVPSMRARSVRRMPMIWLRERFPQVAAVTLPATPLLILVPLGALAARRSLSWTVLAGPLALFLALYASFAYLLPQYILVYAPAMIFLALLGYHRLAALRPANRYLMCAMTLGVVAIALPSFAELNRHVRDDRYVSPILYHSYVQVPEKVETPAIVLFRYLAGDDVHEEPVYNLGAINPDTLPIIRAHDLGDARNRELFAYYAASQPSRTVYRFDRHTWQLVRLGNVVELAR